MFLPQIPGLVTRFNMGPLRVNRPGLGTVADDFGDYITADPQEIELNPVHVQTLTGKELEQDPSFDAHREMICLFSHQRMFVSDDGEIADRVEYRDRSYRVVKVEDYEQHGGIYISAAVLEDAPFDEEHC